MPLNRLYIGIYCMIGKTATFDQSPTLHPTPAPTYTTAPTSQATENIPYLRNVYCDEYSTSDTQDARINTVSCYFTACERDQFEVTLCNSCEDDAFLRLYDSHGSELASDDDSCQRCPRIMHSRSDASCGVYEIRQGCYGDTACSGETRVLLTSQCPDGFIEHDGSCYSYSTVFRDYAAAKSVCAESNAQLVTINSKQEASWVMKTFDDYPQIYVGYTDIAMEGLWVWEDNSSTYVNWAVNEPDGGLYENCATLLDTGTMLDFDCTFAFSSVCEYACPFCATAFNNEDKDKESSINSSLVGTLLGVGIATLFLLSLVLGIYLVRGGENDDTDTDREFGDFVMTQAPATDMVLVNATIVESLAPSAPRPRPTLDSVKDKVVDIEDKNNRITIVMPEAPITERL